MSEVPPYAGVVHDSGDRETSVPLRLILTVMDSVLIPESKVSVTFLKSNLVSPKP